MVMAKMDLHGIFPPISTPFVKGRLSLEHLEKNIAKMSRTGIRGFVVLGSNGEAALLSHEEKKALVETVVRSSPKEMVIIAGTGCESTDETIRLTNECAAIGVHAALVLPPFYYWDKMSDEALFRHYSDLADQSRVPILLYNVPKFTHIRLGSGLISKLSLHKNIIGIKDSSSDLVLLGDYINAAGPGFEVLVGTANVLFAGLSLGAAGGIMALANAAPEACVKLFDLVQKGDFESAKVMQLKLIPIGKAVTATYGVAGLKAAMDMVGYFGGDPRPPLLPSSEAEKVIIRNMLNDLGLA